ncbi:MAG TPA: NADPH-dependent FMN reductase [Acidaminococcaceae bacterium]|nr:NADPH-dependent FMN reductase [Acidaminococcaceae bacterium]
MAKKILVISTSLRNNSNSEKLAKSFAEGAKAAGNEVELVTLLGKNIGFCKGCLACQKTGHCIINDDANPITEKMLEAEVIVWATPVYYYEMSGQMKTLIDRANPLFPKDYKFRDVYLLTAGAEDEPDLDEGAVHGLNGWIACYQKARLAGTVCAFGVCDPGDIEGNTKLTEAYEMGKSIV